MFGEVPEGYVPTAEEQDLHERMVPTEEQKAVAAAMIRARVGDVADSWDTCKVVVPLAFPGKTHGFWTLGQEVAHPDGFYLSDGRTHAAMYLAEARAWDWMGDRDGTVGHAYIWIGDGEVRAAMWESLPRRVLPIDLVPFGSNLEAYADEYFTHMDTTVIRLRRGAGGVAQCNVVVAFENKIAALNVVNAGSHLSVDVRNFSGGTEGEVEVRAFRRGTRQALPGTFDMAAVMVGG